MKCSPKLQPVKFEKTESAIRKSMKNATKVSLNLSCAKDDIAETHVTLGDIYTAFH